MCFRSGFMPRLHEKGLEAVAILQQGGAPAVYALPVQEYFVDKFSGWWIGHLSDTAWPP
jgi:hypothetical protein